LCPADTKVKFTVSPGLAFIEEGLNTKFVPGPTWIEYNVAELGDVVVTGTIVFGTVVGGITTVVGAVVGTVVGGITTVVGAGTVVGGQVVGVAETWNWNFMPIEQWGLQAPKMVIPESIAGTT